MRNERYYPTKVLCCTVNAPDWPLMVCTRSLHYAQCVGNRGEGVVVLSILTLERCAFQFWFVKFFIGKPNDIHTMSRVAGMQYLDRMHFPILVLAHTERIYSSLWYYFALCISGIL